MNAASAANAANVPGWYRIGGDGRGDVVLAVDVDGTARSEATFHDLVPLLPGIGDVQQTTLPDDLPDDLAAGLPGDPTGATLDWFLDGWSQAMYAWAPRVRAVFGYCSGGLFALALADRLEDRYGLRPQVVLFDPERPTASTILDDFTHAMQAMSALQPEERAGYVLRGRHIAANADESGLEQVVARLAEVYGEACGTNLERLGVAADIGVELETAFRSYGRYLVCAAEIRDGGRRWGDATALLSAEASAAAADGLGVRHLRIEAARDDLLRSDATAAQVRSLLRSVAA